MAPTSSGIPVPFSLRVEPIDRILLLNLTDDPHYEGIEIQWYDDAIHGRGLVALLSRHDRITDVYFEPGVRLDRSTFQLGAGIGEWRETEMRAHSFHIGPAGVEVDVRFTDAEGRVVGVHIDETDERRRYPETLLAPVSSGIEHPRSLLLAYLRRFDFVHREGTFVVNVGDRQRTVATLPVPIDFSRVYMSRYSADPTVVHFNGPMEGSVPCVSASSLALDEGSVAELDPEGRVAAIRSEAGGHEARAVFEPPFPDVRGGESAEGAWRIDIDDDAAVVAGRYRLTPDEGGASLTLDVTQGWEPKHLKPSFRVMTTVMASFRSWPKTYRWTGRIDLSGAEPTLTGGWHRTEEGAAVQLVATRTQFELEQEMAVSPEARWRTGRSVTEAVNQSG